MIAVTLTQCHLPSFLLPGGQSYRVRYESILTEAHFYA